MGGHQHAQVFTTLDAKCAIYRPEWCIHLYLFSYRRQALKDVIRAERSAASLYNAVLLTIYHLIFLRRKVPGQTGARIRDLRQHRLALNTNVLTRWARSPFLKKNGSLDSGMIPKYKHCIYYSKTDFKMDEFATCVYLFVYKWWKLDNSLLTNDFRKSKRIVDQQTGIQNYFSDQMHICEESPPGSLSRNNNAISQHVDSSVESPVWCRHLQEAMSQSQIQFNMWRVWFDTKA
jgi:hypothetical protein